MTTAKLPPADLASVIGGVVGILVKLEPAVAAVLASARARGELPESLHAAVDALDPSTVLDPYQQRIDAIRAAESADTVPPTQPGS